MKHLKVKETLKTKTNGSCKQCLQPILAGTYFLSVFYEDGFIKRPYGRFHKTCFDVYKIERENGLIEKESRQLFTKQEQAKDIKTTSIKEEKRKNN